MKHKIDPTVDCAFKNYLLYEQRLDAERLELTWRAVIEQKTAEVEQKTAEVEQKTAEVEQKTAEVEQKTAEVEKERREKERLLALLKKAGIDPNQTE